MPTTHYDSDLSVNDSLALLLGLDLDRIRNGDFDWLLDEIEKDLSNAVEDIEKAIESGVAGKIKQAQARADKAEKLYVDALARHTKLVGEVAKYRSGLPTKIIITRESAAPSKDYSDVYISRQSLYDWAKDELDIDVTELESVPRQNMLGEQVSPQTNYSEGQLTTLCMAYCLDQLLTAKNGDWRGTLGDETDKTCEGFIDNGKLRENILANAVVREIPEALKAKDSKKSIKGHLNFALEHLTKRPDTIYEVSPHQKNFVYRTLFALARATWKAKTYPDDTFSEDYEYPPDIIDVLTKDHSSTIPVSPEKLTKQLNAAKSAIMRLKQNADAKGSRIRKK